MTTKLKIGIIGATGYAGAELLRLLINHPNAEIAGISSVSYEKSAVSDVHLNFVKICERKLQSADEVVAASEIVFACLPHGLSEALAGKCVAKGTVFIDLGADFRLDSEEVYTKWYQKEYSFKDLHKLSVYSIPELDREKIKNAMIIANPGCYPTSVALGLYPALKDGLIETEHIIVDSKSGVTGAGRELSQNTHYSDTNEAFAAYKAGAHRHTPEIEQQLSKITKTPVILTFVPHLLPVNRGIESSIYARLRPGVSFEALVQTYSETYRYEKFVRIEKRGEYANIKNVRYSNYCDISLHYDEHTNTLIISSVLDNMVKGAAGQAIQNMNIRFGFEESAGLTGVAPSF